VRPFHVVDSSPLWLGTHVECVGKSIQDLGSVGCRGLLPLPQRATGCGPLHRRYRRMPALASIAKRCLSRCSITGSRLSAVRNWPSIKSCPSIAFTASPGLCAVHHQSSPLTSERIGVVVMTLSMPLLLAPFCDGPPDLRDR